MLSERVVHLRSGLTLPVLIVGLGGGLIGAAYVGLLHLLQRWLWPTHHTALVQLAILVAVGITVALIARLGGDSGNVEILVDNIHLLGGADDPRRTIPLVPSSLLCVAAGGGMGPEAPLVQATGTFGTWIGDRLHCDRTDVRVLTITGMAGGLTVLFGAPLGAALFALEILHRRGLQYYEALLPALIGSLFGYGVYVALTGVGIEPVWKFPPIGALHGVDLLAAVGLGLVAGVASLVFVMVSRVLRRMYRFVPSSVRPVVGGLVLGLLAFWSPYALTFGEAQLGGLLTAKLTIGALAVAVTAKLAGTTVTMASEWKGGFIIPLFFMGAAMGQIAHQLVPALSEPVAMAAMMAALCTGVLKTPLGATLVVTEMAGIPVLAVTVIAAVVALLVTSPLTLIETQRARDPRPGESEPGRSDDVQWPGRKP